MLLFRRPSDARMQQFIDSQAELSFYRHVGATASNPPPGSNASRPAPSSILVWSTLSPKVTLMRMADGLPGSHPSQRKPAHSFIGCFLKNSQIRSLAEMFMADLPMNPTGGFCPGQVCPPPSTTTRTTSAPSLPGP